MSGTTNSDSNTCFLCLEECSSSFPKVLFSDNCSCKIHAHLRCSLEYMSNSDKCPICRQKGASILRKTGIVVSVCLLALVLYYIVTVSWKDQPELTSLTSKQGEDLDPYELVLDLDIHSFPDGSSIIFNKKTDLIKCKLLDNIKGWIFWRKLRRLERSVCGYDGCVLTIHEFYKQQLHRHYFNDACSFHFDNSMYYAFYIMLNEHSK